MVGGTRGAVIGGLIGALAGGVIGNYVERRDDATPQPLVGAPYRPEDAAVVRMERVQTAPGVVSRGGTVDLGATYTVVAATSQALTVRETREVRHQGQLVANPTTDAGANERHLQHVVANHLAPDREPRPVRGHDDGGARRQPRVPDLDVPGPVTGGRRRDRWIPGCPGRRGVIGRWPPSSTGGSASTSTSWCSSGRWSTRTGVPFPGRLVLMTVGYLSLHTADPLSLLLVIGLATAGTLAGDHLWYVVGRFQGYRLFAAYSHFMRLSPSRIRAADRLLRRFGGLALVLGRVAATVRIVLAPLAVSRGMSYPRFITFDAAGAAAWTSSLVLLGRVAGAWAPPDRLVTILSMVATLGIASFVIGMVARRIRMRAVAA